MRTARRSLLALLHLLPIAIHAITLDCSKIRDDDVSFNLKKLGGPKTVHHQEQQTSPPTTVNTTFTVDICQAISDEDPDKNKRCPSNTRVCGKEWKYQDGTDPFLNAVIPIAGEYSTTHGSQRALDPKYTRLKGSASNSDGKEGVIVELHGGKYPDDSSGTTQKAIIEFLCDKTLTGNEGFEDSSVSDFASYGSMQRRADDNKDESGDDSEFPDLDEGHSLRFTSYQMEGDTKVLRLNWKTKYACEDVSDSEGDNKTGGWGFFTWFIIIVFLLAAAYIIFGSWLNYNRYGARGWDLLPHGDAIRDIPYLLRDWVASFGDKLKGQSSSRGGYSAV